MRWDRAVVRGEGQVHRVSVKTTWKKFVFYQKIRILQLHLLNGNVQPDPRKTLAFPLSRAHQDPFQDVTKTGTEAKVEQSPACWGEISPSGASLNPATQFCCYLSLSFRIFLLPLFLTNEVSLKHVLAYSNTRPPASDPGLKQLLSNLIRRGSGKGQGSSPRTPDRNNSRRL